MGLIGYKGPGAPFQPGIDQNAMQIGPDQFAGQRPETAKPGFFGKGGMGRDLLMGGLGGILDGVAVWGGAKPGYQTATSEGRDFQRELVKAQLLQKLKGDSRTTAAQNLIEAGYQPGTPEYQQAMRTYMNKPANGIMMIDGQPYSQAALLGGQDAPGVYWVENGSEGPGFYDNPEGR